MFLFKPPCMLTTLRVIYSFRHSHSGMETLWRLFPISWDWKAELKKPSPGPLQKRAKGCDNSKTGKIGIQRPVVHYQIVFTEAEWYNQTWHQEKGNCSSLRCTTHLMLWVIADRDSLAGNCPELQGLEVTKMYTLACTKHHQLSLEVFS